MLVKNELIMYLEIPKMSYKKNKKISQKSLIVKFRSSILQLQLFYTIYDFNSLDKSQI